MQEQRRNRGYGRALLESIEEIARFLQIPRLLLCSTDDNDTKVRQLMTHSISIYCLSVRCYITMSTACLSPAVMSTATSLLQQRLSVNKYCSSYSRT